MDWSCQSENKLCYNQDPHRNNIVNWINSIWPNYISVNEAPDAFDFTTKGILQTAIKRNEFWRLMDQQQKASGLIGIMPQKAITFIDNHDTGSTQAHWPFGDREQVMQGYAYILTHPGTPCVFWDHYFDWGLKEDIKKLNRLRQSIDIKPTSKLYIQDASFGLYAAFIDDKIAMKIGPRSWNPDLNAWELYHSGHNWAVWIRK
jgi:alpha-amylase